VDPSGLAAHEAHDSGPEATDSPAPFALWT
jgi:hypothetical protein